MSECTFVLCDFPFIIFMGLEFYRKILDICEILRNFFSSRSRDLLRKYGRRAEMTKLRIAFGNFAKAPRKRNQEIRALCFLCVCLTQHFNFLVM